MESGTDNRKQTLRLSADANVFRGTISRKLVDINHSFNEREGFGFFQPGGEFPGLAICFKAHLPRTPVTEKSKRGGWDVSQVAYRPDRQVPRLHSTPRAARAIRNSRGSRRRVVFPRKFHASRATEMLSIEPNTMMARPSTSESFQENTVTQSPTEAQRPHTMPLIMEPQSRRAGMRTRIPVAVRSHVNLPSSCASIRFSGTILLRDGSAAFSPKAKLVILAAHGNCGDSNQGAHAAFWRADGR